MIPGLTLPPDAVIANEGTNRGAEQVGWITHVGKVKRAKWVTFEKTMPGDAFTHIIQVLESQGYQRQEIHANASLELQPHVYKSSDGRFGVELKEVSPKLRWLMTVVEFEQ